MALCYIISAIYRLIFVYIHDILCMSADQKRKTWTIAYKFDTDPDKYLKKGLFAAQRHRVQTESGWDIAPTSI